MVGSVPELGNWNPQQEGVRMTWTEGHIWRVKFKRNQLPPTIEFKFVIRDGQGVVRWERDPNHKFNLPEYIKKFSQPDAIEALKDGGMAGGVANLTFDNSEDMISYNKHKKGLSCFSPWRPQ